MARILNVVLSHIAVFGFGFCGWAFGIAAAKGFFSTLAACAFPPYAWVVFAQFVLEHWPC